VVFIARARDRRETSAVREVIRSSDACGNEGGQGAECERARELLEELRRRTLEIALWAEVESGRNIHRLEVEIQPQPPRPPTRGKRGIQTRSPEEEAGGRND
jgi:hypothetical protein